MRIYEYKLQQEFVKEIPSIKVIGPEDAYRYLAENCFNTSDGYRENAYLLFMNGANEIIGHSLLSFGGTKCTVIDVKIAVKLAIMKMASAVILAHNHPSGNPAPSSSDIEQTRQLKNALAFFDIQLLDHIIVSDDSYYSFSDEVTHKVS